MRKRRSKEKVKALQHEKGVVMQIKGVVMQNKGVITRKKA